jgi:hypothetical protein
MCSRKRDSSLAGLWYRNRTLRDVVELPTHNFLCSPCLIRDYLGLYHCWIELSKDVSAATNICWRRCFLCGPCPSLWKYTVLTKRDRRHPSVGAGKNTSKVIPASRKRRRKGNPVVSDETVMYGYESSTILTTDRLHYKLQTRPLVTGGAPRRRAKEFSGKRKEKVKSGHGPQRGARNQDILTDWLSVVK